MSVNITLAARNLAKMDLIGKSDPYFTVYSDGHRLHKSETVKNNQNPTWHPFKLSAPKDKSTGVLDMTGQLKFSVYDDDSGKDDFMGGFVTTLQDLMVAEKSGKTFPLFDPEKASSRKDSGEFYVVSFKWDP